MKRAIQFTVKIAAALLFAVISTGAFAQDDMFIPKPPPADVGVRGEFVRSSANSFTCNIEKSLVKHQGELPSIDQPCLYLGPDAEHSFAIGGEALPLLQRLGKPAQTESDINGNTSFIFPMAPGQDPPFMLVMVSHERIAALQISGHGGPELDFLKFNRIKLGDNSSIIKENLGDPFKVQPGKETGTEMWSYLPWSFQFEITDAKVTSIRISSLGIR